MREKESILAELIKSYQSGHKKSAEVFAAASRILVRGGSHNLRLFYPYPFYDIQSEGSKVTDIDGYTYVDFWQGHFGNILGHNPEVVLDALKEYMSFGQGLITGYPIYNKRNPGINVCHHAFQGVYAKGYDRESRWGLARRSTLCP